VKDIRILVDYFIGRQNAENGTHIEGMDREAMNALIKYDWPGNVRELEIGIERACLDAQTGIIKLENLVRFGAGGLPKKPRLQALIRPSRKP
jgi:transcriptional regulator with PAS, ATPase and Fis domain